MICPAVSHSLKDFLPEIVLVGMVDEVQVFHYDRNTRRAEPGQDWMNQITAGHQSTGRRRLLVLSTSSKSTLNLQNGSSTKLKAHV